MEIKLFNAYSFPIVTGIGKRLLKIIMKTFIFLMCTTVFCMNTESSFAQKTVTIEKNQLVTVDYVFKIIKKQTELNFIYPKDLFKTMSKVQIKKGEIEASKLINLVLDNSNFSSKLTKNNTIIINEVEVVKVVKQDIIITGKVVDESGMPLPGVNVIIQNSITGTLTDFEGDYSIKAKEGDVIMFSYVGFASQNITVTEVNTIDAVMIEERSALDEVVVIGYGTQKKSNLTAAISTVNTKELENRPVSSLTQMLSASVPGLNIGISSSAPNANPSINIRGFTGLNQRGSPLVIVDGVPLDNANDLKYVNSQDVEDISVLKDASATAIYGSRAPNGAILITTKSGKKGQKMSIDYSSDVRVSTPIGLPNSLSGSQYAYERNNRRYNSRTGGGTPIYSEETIARILAYEAGEISTVGIVTPDGKYGGVFSFNASEDHLQNAFRNNVFNETHNLSLSGGSDKTTYFASFNKLDADGIYQSDIDWLKRYTTNLRVNTDVTSWLNVGLNSKYSREQTMRPATGNGQNDGNFFNDIGAFPTVPVYYDNGTPNEFSILPGLDGRAGQYEGTTDVLTSQITAKLTPAKGLTVNADYTWRVKNTFNKNVRLQFGGLDYDGTTIASRRSSKLTDISEISSEQTYHTANFNINYKIALGDHNFNALVGYNQEEFNLRSLTGYNSEFYTNSIQALAATYGENMVATDNYNAWAVQGYYGRFHYDYKEKYLVDFSGRYDASSRFSPDSRWAFFPSVSVGYNMAKENFWPLKETVGLFKFTGQYGESGNQGGAPLYSYLPTLGTTPRISTPINGSLPPAVTMPPILADDNTWAKPRNVGFGLEVGMFNNRLTSSYSWYQTTVYDQIGPAIQLPEVLGTLPPKRNNTITERRGFEFNINWRDQFELGESPFSYGIRAGLSDYIGYVVEYDRADTGGRNSFTPGQLFGELYGVQSAGIAQNQDQVLSNVIPRNGFYYPGDLFYNDTNGDGLISYGQGNFWYSQGDRERLGFTYPRYQYNVAMNANWKGFSLNVLFQGVGHQKVYWANKFNFGTFNYISEEQQERGWWTANNTDASMPRAYRLNIGGLRENQNNDQFENNLAHLRIKNIGLTYSFPKELLDLLNLTKMSLTVSGENLGFVFNKSWTPELDPITIATNQGRTYPPSRTFSLGLRVGI